MESEFAIVAHLSSYSSGGWQFKWKDFPERQFLSSASPCKLSNLRQKILERLVKNFEQISYSFSTNKPFTWNQHLHFKMIIKLIVTFVMRDFNSFVESFLLSFFSSFSVTYLRGEIVIYEYLLFSISYNLHQVIVCHPLPSLSSAWKASSARVIISVWGRFSVTLNFEL